MSSLFDKDFSMTSLSGDFLKAYGSDPNVVGYYYDESTGQMHAKMKNGSIATYGANFKKVQPFLNRPPATSSKTDDIVETKTKATSSYIPPTIVKPTPSTPSVISTIVSSPPPPPVKTAPIDTVLFDDESVPIEVMTDLIFEDIGGQELINIIRNDLINGQKLDYVPIKNITNIQRQYNPNNILSLQNTSDKYFANFNISLDDKIPTGATSTGLSAGDPFIYIDSDTGDLIIELANLTQDNEVQVSFVSNGTIYELEIDES